MALERIVAISPTDPERYVIDRAAAVLNRGGVVVAPTETRYGLLVRADDAAALERLYNAKGRPATMPTSLFVRDRHEMAQFGHLTPQAGRLIERFLPGPLTLVVRAKGTWEPQVVVNERIGYRWSSSPVIAALLKQVSFPVTATSANRSGGPELDTVTEIAAALGDLVELYLDAGPLKGITSTVVDCSGESVTILRAGAIPPEMIAESVRDLQNR